MKIKVNKRQGKFRECAELVTDDGRVMFSIDIGQDGRSIEIRGVDCCLVDGIVYSSQLVVVPRVSNSIIIKTEPYAT